MSFKRKFWKRGDKLNAKELNRIEEALNSLSTNDNDQSSLIPLITYVTVNTDGVEVIEDTDGALIPEENFSMSFSDIINKVKNNETIVFKVYYNFITPTGIETHEEYLCPIRLIRQDTADSVPQYTIYADSGHMGCFMYVGEATGPLHSIGLTISEYGTTEKRWHAGVCLYDIYPMTPINQ